MGNFIDLSNMIRHTHLPWVMVIIFKCTLQFKSLPVITTSSWPRSYRLILFLLVQVDRCIVCMDENGTLPIHPIPVQRLSSKAECDKASKDKLREICWRNYHNLIN